MMSRSDNNLKWCAEYTNGSVVHQFDRSGSVRSFMELSRINLKRLMLTDGDRIIVSQDLLPGMSPIYRFRNFMSSNINSSKKIHILGWILWDKPASDINASITFVDDRTNLVEIGFFVNGVGMGASADYKYPIQPTTEDYIPISWI
jgi:hypothetical protein